MTEEQTQKLQNLLDHIKSNAIEIIDNQRVSNTQIFNAMYSSGVKYLSDNSDQTIVDIGALALAHKIRNM